MANGNGSPSGRAALIRSLALALAAGLCRSADALCDCASSSFGPDMLSGDIKSPAYPGAYCNSLDCTWSVEPAGSDDMALRLEFEYFNTERTHDYLLLTINVPPADGGAGPLRNVYTERLSGGAVPGSPFVTPRGAGLTLQFVSDGSVTMGGFFASFTRLNVSADASAACPPAFYEATPTTRTEITSAGYPKRGGVMRCYYVLESGQDGRSVKVTLSELVSSGAEESWQLYEADRNVTALSRPVLSLNSADGAPTLPQTYTSRGHRLMVVHSLAFSTGDGGFRATIERADSPCLCLDASRTIRSPRQMTSPGYPNQHYCDDLNCQYELECETGAFARFVVHDFATEQRVDKVEIFDRNRNGAPGDAAVAEPMLRLTGEGFAGASLTANGPRAAFVFSTDRSVTNTGYNVSFDCINRGCACPSPQPLSFNTAEGTIAYEHPADNCQYIDCLYVLVQPNSDTRYHLVMNVTLRPAEPDGYLLIAPADGTPRRALTSRPLKLSSRTADHRVTYNRAHNIRIQYHAASASAVVPAGTGFTVKYQWLQRCKCGGDGGGDVVSLRATSQPQQLASPDYPRAYCELLNCKWIIAAPAGHQVQLSIGDFRTENQYDHVSVYEGEVRSDEQAAGASRLARLSGLLYAVTPRRSTGDTLSVWLHTDGSVEYRGFRATYSAVPITTTGEPESATDASAGGGATDSSAGGSGSAPSFGSALGWLLAVIAVIVLAGLAYYYYDTRGWPRWMPGGKLSLSGQRGAAAGGGGGDQSNITWNPNATVQQDTATVHLMDEAYE